jgi:hypothetical protein
MSANIEHDTLLHFATPADYLIYMKPTVTRSRPHQQARDTFSSASQRPRRSTPVMISIGLTVPDLSGAHTSAL